MISGARFSLMGLCELREQLGARWPELSDRVHDLAETVIRRHLKRGDVFDTHAGDGYVILFADLTERQAEFKCRVIAKEIAAKLLGADWVGRTAEGVVFELSETALAEASFDRALHEVIAKGRPVEIETAPAPKSLPRNSHPIAVAAPVPEAKAPEQAMTAIGRERGRISYTPIWEFGAEAILRFRFRPQVLNAGAPLSEIARADMAALTEVLFDVGRLTSIGRRLPIICPLRFDTVMRDGWRVEIIRMLQASPAIVRRLVALEVVVDPDEADWLGPLERAWTAMPGAPLVTIPLKTSKAPIGRSELVRHLNLALTDGFCANKTGIAALGAFAQKAERMGLTCGVMGLDSRAAVLAATAAGFRQLSGPAVHHDVAELSQATHFDLKTLYRDLLTHAI